MTLSVYQKRNDFIAKYISSGINYQKFLLTLDGRNKYKACLSDNNLCLMYHQGDRSLRHLIVSHKGAGEGILDLVINSKNNNEVRYFIAGRSSFRKILISKILENPSEKMMPYIGLSLNLKKLKNDCVFSHTNDNYEFKRLIFLGFAQNVTATTSVLCHLIDISFKNSDLELLVTVLNNQNTDLYLISYILKNNKDMDIKLPIAKTLLRMKGCYSK